MQITDGTSTREAGNGTVLWARDGRGIATLTLNRPEVNNAYNGEMISGLHEAMDALALEAGVRVVVVRGAGKHFQAGADLRWIAALAGEGADANFRASRATADAVRRLETLPMPTIALVQGGCFGGGTGIVAACDVVIATDDAQFSITETRWGLTPGIILPQLCRALGIQQVRRYALSGERFGAQQAQRLGFVHEVCAPASLAERCNRIVDTLLMNAPGATSSTKQRMLSLSSAYSDPVAFEDLVREHAHFRQQVEAREGTASFIEKRKPAWYPGEA